VGGEDAVWLWIESGANAEEKSKGQNVASNFCKRGMLLCWIKVKIMVGSIRFLGIPSWKGHDYGYIYKSLHVKEVNEMDSNVKSFTPVLYKMLQDANSNMSKVASANPPAQRI
jgi:hypothetical protein